MRKSNGNSYRLCPPIGYIVDGNDKTFFFEEKGRLMTDEKVDVTERVQFLLMHPWSADCMTYKTYRIEAGWKCRYKCINYDTLSVSVCGYGESEEEAEAECAKNLEKIEKIK